MLFVFMEIYAGFIGYNVLKGSKICYCKVPE